MAAWIQFADQAVSYSTFVNDLAECLLSKLEKRRKYPEFINQRNAYKVFGRSNIDRWRRKGMVDVYKRPGVVEYRTSQLRALQATEQDYLIR